MKASTNFTDILTQFPQVRTLWSNVNVTDFGPYYEALQARLIDRVWHDELLKQEILIDPKAVFERESDITFPANVEVRVLEEPEDTFYFVIPATPRAEEQWYRYEQLATWWMLGHTWWTTYYYLCGAEKARAYRESLQALWIARIWTNEAFHEKITSNPKATFEAEMGAVFPPNLKIQSLQETSNLIYFVLPKNPQVNQIDENSTMGQWWQVSHTWWWWLVNLRFRQPAKNTVTGIVS
ncbi:hypothetical protein C7Y66_15160 [Chroococcidiopsis sp. CCALA 051]|uniref:NHLP leader peptide family RiPP precursor n=1 Tax=Chroococcidiopsis sp. CCALA 051 TaxID=869949 RepID=UPI000D0DEBE7|nr:NHLP leader peptide family RiPP precursor [Chroococcidiopsis sp. CCALA 051]PSM48333.1 hypothetical protein C7Y66_15160 [Chroococcidiopsis sp. CCALA 051]